jgi:hypothetical protein
MPSVKAGLDRYVLIQDTFRKADVFNNLAFQKLIVSLYGWHKTL